MCRAAQESGREEGKGEAGVFDGASLLSHCLRLLSRKGTHVCSVLAKGGKGVSYPSFESPPPYILHPSLGKCMYNVQVSLV